MGLFLCMSTISGAVQIGTACPNKANDSPAGAQCARPGCFFASNCCPVNFCAEWQRAFVAQERLVCYNNTVIMGLQAKNAALQTKNRANVRERQGACAGIGH